MNENLKKHDPELIDLRLKLLDQCFQNNLHHLGSAFSSLPVIYEIYKQMTLSDKFILSNGHAAAALYVVLEKFRNQEASKLFKEIGDHPKRNVNYNIDCSTGSLGMGITVAVGMAIANPEINIYCLVSDGECSEGSVWEALRFSNRKNLNNLHFYFSLNGWAGYDPVDLEKLASDLLSVYPKSNIRFTNNSPFEEFGLKGHYMNLSENLYLEKKEQICAEHL